MAAYAVGQRGKGDLLNESFHKSGEAPRRRSAYQDVLDAPRHMVAEVVDGTLTLNPGPSARHVWASSSLGIEVGSPFGRGRGDPGGWWIINEPELHFGEHGTDIVVPDIAGWRHGTMPEYPDAEYLEITPDWACEVLSPGMRAFDLGRKRAVYAREAAGHLWFVGPGAKMLEAFELREGRRALLDTLSDDAAVSLTPFGAISFPFDALWPEDSAPTAGHGSASSDFAEKTRES